MALRTAGGGKVTETEKGDEESYYQVEVTRADGTVMDVNLNRSFKVVKTKTEAGETKDDRKDAGGHEDGKTDGETKDDGPQG